MTITKQSAGPVTAQAPQSSNQSSSSDGSVHTPSTGATALAANSARIAWLIQNLGTNPLYVYLGAGATTSKFSFILKGCTAQDDGTSPPFSDEVWKGDISVAGTSPRLALVELQ